MRLCSTLVLTALALALGPPAVAAPVNDFEWCAVAPIVLSAVSLGDNGRYHEVEVVEVLRGDVEPGTVLKIDLRQANRSRNIDLRERAVHPETDRRYILLLEPGQSAKARKNGAYWIVRGVHGVRELPEEGAAPMLEMLSRFVEIQDLKNDTLTWQRFSEMLGARDPRLVSTALQQFRKFRRGSVELVAGLRPLLEHPQPEIRGEAAGLLGQIVDRFQTTEIPESEGLKTDLVARATRDPDVDVRVASTRALGEYDDVTVVAVLEGIAESDPEQLVRFTAEKLLFERRQETRAAGESRASGG